MRRLVRRSGAVLVSCTLGAFSASCVLHRGPDPTRFYVLTANADSPRPKGSLSIGLGPIVMPGYLQQPGLATRVGPEVRYASADRWAERLPALFGRVLGQELSARVGARIVPYPWHRAAPVDLVVRVEVTSFEANAAGNATLDACWTIRGSRAEPVCREGCSSIMEAVDEPGARAQVAALSRTIGELAQRIANAIPSCRQTSERPAG